MSHRLKRYGKAFGFFVLQFAMTPAVAHGQTRTPGGPNFLIENLRAQALQHLHHPEHGGLRLDQLFSIEPLRSRLPFDRHLSIFVSDVETVSQIKFSEVMDKLVRDSGDKLLTKQVLFHQWWDSAGQGPGLGLGPHCDDDSAPAPPGGIANNTSFSLLNNFPYRCPRLERSEASSDPFTDESATNPAAYRAIAFSNRFDLVTPPARVANTAGLRAPDCGEYRIVFARNSGAVPGADGLNRNLIIFEARVPNPAPADGLKGCRPILEFWQGLSDKSLSATARGIRLHDFYLKGLPGAGVGPIVDASHYTFGTGQIRSNQFMANTTSGAQFEWTLREFKTLALNGTLAIVPDSVKSNPGETLFAPGATDVRVAALNQDIRAQMKSIIAGPTASVAAVNEIGFQTTGEGANSFESNEGSNADKNSGNIDTAYAPGGAENPVLKANIQSSLTLAGAPLTPLNVIGRIRTQTCSGCHHFSNGDSTLGGGAIWPDKAKGDNTHKPMDFTQESELFKDLQPAIAGSGERYAISSAVECFLDFREEFMRKALNLPGRAAGSNCPAAGGVAED